jgi:alpha-1,6-mannosyltransferase
MRIVDVNEFYSPTGGGVRTYVDRKMALAAELGHELICIAPGRETRVEERPGGRIHYLRSPGMPFDKNYGLFWRGAPLRALLDEYRPDLVESCSPWRPAWIVGRWQGNAAKVFFMHNDNIAAYPQRWLEGVATHERIEEAFGWYTRYMNRFLGLYDAVVTNGPALAKRLSRRGLRIDAAMPLGIERGHFSPDFRSEATRRALLRECGLGPDALLLLGVGRHHPEKRWPVVIDAVRRAGRQTPVGLVLLGAGVESARLLRLAAGEPGIRLFRPVYDRANLARFMASADALIHGSEAEPFGLVASEAMASGLPLIVPDTGGCAEVGDPASAELYRARDPEAAAAAILRFVARDRDAMRTAARRSAARVRTDREHVADLFDYYEGLVAARASARAQPQPEAPARHVDRPVAVALGPALELPV